MQIGLLLPWAGFISASTEVSHIHLPFDLTEQYLVKLDEEGGHFDQVDHLTNSGQIG